MTNLSTLPQDVNLDLDVLELELAPDFRVAVGGRTLAFHDPAGLNWQEVLFLDNPLELFRLCLSNEDKNFLLDQNIPAQKISKLFEGFSKHFKLDEQMAAARRQAKISEM